MFTFDDSDCIYFFDYGRSKKFNKRSNTCTNRFDRCSVDGCISEIWKYNFRDHVLEKHPEVDPDTYPVMKIEEAEKNFLLKKRQKGK